MKAFRILAALAFIGMAALLTTGCGGKHYFVDMPGMPVSTNAVGGGYGADRTIPIGSYYEVIHVGDPIVIVFAGPGTEASLPTHAETVKENGMITPPQVGLTPAAGKTPSQLQKELQAKYDVRYRNLTVTVRIGDRFYYVDGDVGKRGPQMWVAGADIVTAISAAGGFTEFAKKTKVRLTHPNGRSEVIDYNKAVLDPNYRFPVYPNDKIFVPRKFW
jgi:polysaccharide biosynthesis/export protein